MLKKVTSSIKVFIAEYKQVRWPTLRIAINLTIFVIIISAIITIMIIGLDSVFFELRSRFIIR